MLRKTLTILSLIALLVSVGAWGVSWYGISIGRHSTTRLDSVDLADGILWYVWEKTNSEELKTVGQRRVEWGWRASKGPLIQLASDMHSRWVPSYHGPLTGTISAMWLPLYLPVLFFAIWPTYVLLPFHRRRKRKKPGLCLKCGYDLRASKDRCPECGQEFEKHCRQDERRGG